MSAVVEGHGIGATPSPSYFSLGRVGWLFTAATAAVFAFISPNPALTAASILLVPFFATMLWRRGEPPILFFAVVFQWLQGTTKTFDADIRGLTLVEYFKGWTIQDAAWLTIVGLVVLTLGMRVALISMDRSAKYRLGSEVKTLSIKKIWYVYLASFAFALIGPNYFYYFPRFSQILLAMVDLKWAFFFLLAMVTILRREQRLNLWVAVTMEVVVGFTGFFSDYKKVFFVLILVLLTVSERFTRRIAIRAGIALVVVGYLSIVWSTVKLDYRDYLNQGSGKQIITVSVGDRLNKIFDLYSDVKWTEIEDGVELLARRVAYIDYFGYVLENVPRQIPYADGELWGQAISHVLFPRLLFPNKPALASDTEVNEKYTGLQLIVQGGRDTNVPLGYMTETYIDFGRYYMFAMIFFVGVVWGLMYRYFLTRKKELVFSYGLAVAVLLGAAQLEVSTVKMVGGMLMGFIVMALTQKVFLPRIHMWLLDRNRIE